MQRVVHDYRNKSRIFNMLENMYAYISDKEYDFDDILWLDETFKPLCKILEEYLLLFRVPEFKQFDLPRIPCPKLRPKEITVCLSGGKDSAACAYYYIKKGYRVHLYHVTGVNKAYGDEKKAAQRIADYLGCDLFIDHIWTNGKNTFIEHPMKNYLIANGAIHYCLAMGYTPHIAFGNFNKARLEVNAFDVCAGDCIEMWDVYRPIIQKVLPEFDIKIPLETNADTFNLLSNDWKLFELSVSCMSPYRFRAFWKHRCEEQYNVRLFDNRCGVCWKCCIEEMWLMDTGKMDYSLTYYMHCYGILASTIKKEMGVEADYMSIWNNYMWYPIEKSKAYEVLPRVTFKHVANMSVQVYLEGVRIDAPISTKQTIGTE